MTLPVYEVERFECSVEDAGMRTMLCVVCPRCQGEFWVSFKWNNIIPVDAIDGQQAFPFGRMCPYCSKTSAIPEELREFVIKPKPRRMVKRRKR